MVWKKPCCRWGRCSAPVSGGMLSEKRDQCNGGVPKGSSQAAQVPNAVEVGSLKEVDAAGCRCHRQGSPVDWESRKSRCSTARQVRQSTRLSRREKCHMARSAGASLRRMVSCATAGPPRAAGRLPHC